MLKIFKVDDLEVLDFNKIIESINKYEVVAIIVETCIENMESAIVKYLNINQIKQMNRYHNENDRVNYGVTKGIINSILSKIENIEYSKIKWCYGKYKKPYIGNQLGVKFNLSHTYGCSIIVLSKNEVGVDIEYLGKDIEYSDIRQHFFTNYEKKRIITLEEFYKYWVCKEAYLKYKGVGLIQDLSSIEIVSMDYNKAEITDKEDGSKKNIMLCKIDGKYICAICY